MVFNLFELLKEAKRFSLSLNRSTRANPMLNRMKDLGVSQQLVEKSKFHATDFIKNFHISKKGKIQPKSILVPILYGILIKGNGLHGK